MTDPISSEKAPSANESPEPEGVSNPARRGRYDADGSERPRFILDFPSDPELDQLARAFEAGDFAYVRKEAPGLIARSERPEVRQAAAELRSRIEPDRVVVILLTVAVLFFAALVLWVYAK